jgi:zinc protease
LGASAHIRALLAAGVLLALSVCPDTDARDLPPLSLPVEQHVLANGLHVVLAPDPAVDGATVVVRYDVGSGDDPTGKEGLAHLVEHMMFDGSRHVPHGEYWRWLERAGSSGYNGTTAIDATRYVASVPPEQLPLLLWLESDRMGFPAPNEDGLRRAKTLIADEVRGKTGDQAVGWVMPVLFSELFPSWHPYHLEPGRSGLDEVTLADVRAFLRTWYTPRNAWLIVAGKIDAAATLSLAEKYFGDLPGDAPPVRPILPDRWRPPHARVVMGAGVNRDRVAVGWPAPPLGDPVDSALDLAATILSDPNGRLQKALVATGLVVSVHAGESSQSRGSEFLIGAIMADGVPAEVVEDAIERTVDDLAKTITPEECARARSELATTALLRLQTPAGRAFRLSYVDAALEPWGLHKYDAIGAGEIASAVRRVLAPSNRVSIVVHHDRRYPAGGVVLSREERP